MPPSTRKATSSSGEAQVEASHGAAVRKGEEAAGVGAVSALALLQKRAEREGDAGDGGDIDEHMTFDLGRLAAFSQKSLGKMDLGNAGDMLERARETTQYIINRLFQLPSEPAEWGRVAHLPAPATALPREKPLPKAKPLTRWEKFAKEKGIQKKKKEKMVWDEINKEWRPRFGYKRAESASDSLPPIIEAGKDDDGSVDPWTKKENEKKERTDKQKRREKRNVEEIYGKPILAGQNEFESRAEAKSQKKTSLALAQKSTGSLGKFDKKLKGEIKGKMKRKVEAPTATKGGEKERNLELLSKIVSVDGATLDYGKAGNQSLNQVSFNRSLAGDDMPQKRKKGKAGRMGVSKGIKKK